MGSAFRPGIAHTPNKCMRAVRINYNYLKVII